MFPRRNKFSNKKVNHAGMRFDSKLEKSVYDMLAMMERGGAISELQHHPGTVFLTPARVQMRPDFRFKEKGSDEYCFAEAKGFQTPEYRIKRRLWTVFGPGKLYVYEHSYGGPKLLETIIPKGWEANPGAANLIGGNEISEEKSE
jgi:hypothetical protein